jgi:hypothetical protein
MQEKIYLLTKGFVIKKKINTGKIRFNNNLSVKVQVDEKIKESPPIQISESTFLAQNIKRPNYKNHPRLGSQI